MPKPLNHPNKKEYLESDKAAFELNSPNVGENFNSRSIQQYNL